MWGKKPDRELHLEGEIEYLRAQVAKLTEALVAKESPIAYGQMKADQAAAEADPVNAEELARMRERDEFAMRYAARIEEPFFTDPEDMISKLTKIVGAPVASSLHGNKES
jgi:hypothetical protein